MPVFSLWKMDSPCMESYLSSSTSFKMISLLLCVNVSFSSLGWYCPHSPQIPKLVVSSHSFLLTSLTCVLKLSDHRPDSPLSSVVLQHDFNAWQIEIGPQRGQLLASCCAPKKRSLPVEDRCSQRQKATEASALHDKQTGAVRKSSV